MPSSVAAARKLPSRATAVTASYSVRPVFSIILILALLHADLSCLSDQSKLPRSSSALDRQEASMKIIDTIYIDGAFVTPHGTEPFDLHNPSTAEVIGQVRLGD